MKAVKCVSRQSLARLSGPLDPCTLAESAWVTRPQAFNDRLQSEDGTWGDRVGKSYRASQPTAGLLGQIRLSTAFRIKSVAVGPAHVGDRWYPRP
jgi:hypothetical protein